MINSLIIGEQESNKIAATLNLSISIKMLISTKFILILTQWMAHASYLVCKWVTLCIVTVELCFRFRLRVFRMCNLIKHKEI